MTQEMLEMGPAGAKVLSVFDFDGTLTRHDSFVPFLKYAFGKLEFAKRLRLLAGPGVRYLTRRLSRDELKARLIAAFLTDAKEEWVRHKAAEFCGLHWTRLMRPAGLASVAAERQAGSEVTLCSASPALVLKPFADRLNIKLIATELEVVDGRLTGRISGDNCRCEAKVRRLEAVYGDLTQYRLRAWGDTRGDHELLAAAQDAHWRHFHPAWRRGRLRVTKTLARDAGVVPTATHPVEGSSENHEQPTINKERTDGPNSD
ncbi:MULTISPECIES: HAD-IB family hydrolase [Pseudomonas]|uniref:HAD-IB family hydrolase n=1 Tax=Pseudomonas nunensis TaxID=2961896 RepID=A0ABY5EHM3_9PSED|nr:MULTISPECIES: HAD-IB family hydrolase [Pseudomonas]MCL5228154.1 HAD-IB family hydrolase [Pseudomonas nunensis]MDN3219325.1 HAD-IB family hydrolase [Pseudomonas nunensis]UTO14964.1 HAD-IB family hydrolase [Pseudomonas nunensis]UZE10941.1 HAD-IB family hydrolase [Pseudomonas sp. B21-053]